MNNRDRLVEAKILESKPDLNPEQEAAINGLTETEVEMLISAKQKLAETFPPDDLAKPITHHH